MSDSLLKPNGSPSATAIDTAPQPELDPTPIPYRNFWLAMGAQFALLATIAAPAIYTLNTGTTVFLQTVPVDPYDLLRGYYQTLNYDIADRAKLAKLPGGNIFKDSKSKPKAGEFFVTLALPSTAGQRVARPHSLLSASAIAVSATRPTNLPTGQIAIRGTLTTASSWWRNQLSYGIEKFYMPESQKDTVNSEIGRNPRKLLVEVKIDSNGHPVPVSLWVGNKSYRF
ncbi:GDYXXLXY domain-containing protein [Chamaesiphon sp. OTE_75_metabat_556]|uniref:GDYXXLXY domain-containing protein n=1 Tax=Chamaesiphon sp. OTE_75_metabat_556 TaxID=2964692 RepID=UPI00286A2FBC|nr:GDYXXLXY domain-containing protein [Chamaesiphon sp. OTE_75_metabat_556]